MEDDKIEPLAVTLGTFCEITSLGRSTAYVLIQQKKLQKLKIRGRTLITVASIKALLSESAINSA